MLCPREASKQDRCGRVFRFVPSREVGGSRARKAQLSFLFSGPQRWGQPWFGLETPQERPPTLCGEGKWRMVGSGRGVGSSVQAGRLAGAGRWSVGPSVVAQAAGHTHWALSWAGAGRCGAGARLAPGCWGAGTPQEWPLQEDLGFRARTSIRGGLVVSPPRQRVHFCG